MGVVVIGSVVDICGVAVIADVCGVVYAVFASVVGFVDGQGEQSERHINTCCPNHSVLSTSNTYILHVRICII